MGRRVPPPMKTMMLIAAIAAMIARGAEPASDAMRQKLRAKIAESFPPSQAAKAAEEATTTVESVVFVRPVTLEAVAIDHRNGPEEEVILMQPLTVTEQR